MFQMRVSVLFTSMSLLPIVPIARSQETRAVIGGRITDPTNAVVPAAEVVVTSEETGVAQRTTSNEEGNWVVQFLLPGQYRFSISARGFRPVERQGVTLQTSDRKTIDVQLELGAATQTVAVVEAAPLIDTSTATSGTVINSQQVNDLPSVNRVPT